MKQATAVARDDLAAMGTLFGKFTKSGKFHLKVTCLDFLSLHAKVRERVVDGVCICVLA